MIFKSVIIMALFFGILFVIIEIVRIQAGMMEKEEKIIYRYIPRTFEEEQEDQIPISDVFNTMFSQPSPWVGSIRNYDEEKQEDVNKYFISQL